jgi:subtilisin family serine protease
MARRSALPLIAASLLGLTACGDQAILRPISPNGANDALMAAQSQPGIYLVGFDGTPSIPADVLQASGGRIIDAIPSRNVLTVDGVTNPDALLAAQPRYIQAAFEVKTSPIVEPLSPFEQLDLAGQEQTPWVKSKVQWDMRVIHADDGWARTNGGQGVNVCIVDTGVDDKHQELNDGRVLARANFVVSKAPAPVPDPEDRVDDPHGHGSHVASTVAARGVVISGVAPRANILSARVLDSLGSGNEGAIVKGIDWCVANGAHVINMSLGGARYRPFADNYKNSFDIYGKAINDARAAGAVVIVSSGNSNLRLPNAVQSTVPSEVPGAINVGATGPLSKSTSPNPSSGPGGWDALNPDHVWRSPDYKAYYSNFGTGVAVFAPGGRGGIPLSEIYRIVGGVGQGKAYDFIWGSCSTNSHQTGNGSVGGVPSGSGPCNASADRYIAYAGTSQAAPHVSGLAALLYEALGSTRNAANGARIEGCIKNTTDNIGPATTYGGGRINVTRALDALTSGGC